MINFAQDAETVFDLFINGFNGSRDFTYWINTLVGIAFVALNADTFHVEIFTAGPVTNILGDEFNFCLIVGQSFSKVSAHD